MTSLEKAVLQTICYSDLFNYCLTEPEIYRYLIHKKASYFEVAMALTQLVQRHKIGLKDSFYFLAGRNELPMLRRKRAEISRTKMQLVKKYVSRFSRLPYLCLLALTGTLSMDNAEETDDIDLLMVFAPKRLFLGRTIEYLILRSTGRRRTSSTHNAQNLFCPNLYLTVDHMEIGKKDLFTAHEIVQMKPLINKHQTYERFLNQNRWITQYLPNSTIPAIQNNHIQQFHPTSIGTMFENLAYILQKGFMSSKMSREKVTKHMLFFHPRDNSQLILSRFSNKLKELYLD